MDQRSANHLIIRGHVQGVGYRWWAKQQAMRLSLEGWVRNRSDGSVELLAIGLPEALEELAKACHRGPPGAEVTALDRTEALDDGSTGFEQRPTD